MGSASKEGMASFLVAYTCDEFTLRANAGRCLTAIPRRARKDRRSRVRAIPRSLYTQARFAAGGLRVRGERDSGAGAEPGNEISVGAVGTLGKQGDAVPQ